LFTSARSYVLRRLCALSGLKDLATDASLARQKLLKSYNDGNKITIIDSEKGKNKH